MTHLLQAPATDSTFLFQKPVQFRSYLPQELDGQLRDLKASIYSLEKKPILLNDCHDPNQEKVLKTEITKLNKEILSLQSDLYKLNTKYISKGLLSPTKASYFPRNDTNFLTPERSFPMDSEATVKPENPNNKLSNEINNFLEIIQKSNPKALNMFTKYFNSPENLKKLAFQQDISTILSNLFQMFTEYLAQETENRGLSLDRSNRFRLNSSQGFEAENKPIDFKNYFKTSLLEVKNPGILKNKGYNYLNSPRSLKKRTEESMRESRCTLEKEDSLNRLYNNRSESERFLNEEQGYSIDDIQHKKKVKPFIKRKKIDIISNIPKKHVS